jgi:hypothetical protein
MKGKAMSPARALVIGLIAGASVLSTVLLA